jgi:hypothetical protein
MTWYAEPRCEKKSPSSVEENGREIGEAVRDVPFPSYPVIGMINSYFI